MDYFFTSNGHVNNILLFVNLHTPRVQNKTYNKQKYYMFLEHQGLLNYVMKNEYPVSHVLLLQKDDKGVN